MIELENRTIKIKPIFNPSCYVILAISYLKVTITVLKWRTKTAALLGMRQDTSKPWEGNMTSQNSHKFNAASLKKTNER